jgi:hypothetical protein
VEEVLAATGWWPVLLALVHGAVQDAVRVGGELRDVLAALRGDDVTVLDDPVTPLDVDSPGQRSRAVAPPIEASLRRLTAAERDRYLELAVFGADVPIPGDVVARFWAHTSGWSIFQTRRFCQRLFDLRLLAVMRSWSAGARIGPVADDAWQSARLLGR